MQRILIGLLVVLLALVTGCGGGEGPGRSGDSTAKEVAKDASCSAGEGHLQVGDVLDKAPAGLEIVEADRKKLEPLTDPLEKALGDRLRGFEARAVVPKGRAVGTAVVIANANEGIGEPGDVLEGARESAKQNGGRFEEITVAGNPAALVDFGEALQISVQLGGCSVGMLIDVDRERLMAVADALHAPDGNP